MTAEHANAQVLTDPAATAPTVLIFRSTSGRTEIARRPDGMLRVNVLQGRDKLDADDAERLTRSLVECRAQDVH